jgi:hypothetical protein
LTSDTNVVLGLPETEGIAAFHALQQYAVYILARISTHSSIPDVVSRAVS